MASEYGRKAEAGELVAPPPVPKVTLRDTLDGLARLRQQRKLLDGWRPRASITSLPTPTSAGDATTPEGAVARWLNAWMNSARGGDTAGLDDL
jgi:hypothetical protein